MNFIVKRTREFLIREDGPTATEYAVLLAVIAMTVIGAMAAFGTRVEAIYTAIESSVGTV